MRIVELTLPEFAEAVKAEGQALIFHQDAFAADYQLSELLALGAAVKYAGMHGKQIVITGNNRETLK